MSRKIELKYVLLTGLLLSFFIVGSFFDYEISKTCYIGQLPSNNFFGILFSFIGVIPTFVGWSFFGAIIIGLIDKNMSLKKRRWLFALAILLFVLSFFYFCNSNLLTNKNAFDVHWVLAYSTGLVIILVSVYLGLLFSKKCNDDKLLNEVLFITAISIITMIITMSSKEIMARPRFRFVLETNNLELYKNWWENGHSLKRSIGNDLLSDEFSSFPSGHSSYSMFAIFVFPLLSRYSDKTKKYSTILFVFGFLWWLLTAFSRITVGAHYLTDVCFGGIITVLSYFIVVLIERHIYKKRIMNKKN